MVQNSAPGKTAGLKEAALQNPLLMCLESKPSQLSKTVFVYSESAFQTPGVHLAFYNSGSVRKRLPNAAGVKRHENDRWDFFKQPTSPAGLLLSKPMQNQHSGTGPKKPCIHTGMLA